MHGTMELELLQYYQQISKNNRGSIFWARAHGKVIISKNCVFVNEGNVNNFSALMNLSRSNWK